jgi:hypothetical protein
MRTPGDFLTKLSIRTMDEIQRHVIKRGKRNVISRLYHAKSDKKAIVTWRLDLDGILHVFNVRSVSPVRRLLTFCFQAEPGIPARATVSDTTQDAANTSTIVSHGGRNKSRSCEGVDDRNKVVSTTRTLPVTE